MKAVYIKEFGGAENLEISVVENPPKPKASGVVSVAPVVLLTRAERISRTNFGFGIRGRNRGDGRGGEEFQNRR